jgi:hypothetical protein
MDGRGRILFVGLVTIYLLMRIFDADATASEMFVYGLAAAFGLEFVIASWPALWARPEQRY